MTLHGTNEKRKKFKNASKRREIFSISSSILHGYGSTLKYVCTARERTRQNYNLGSAAL